MCIIEILDKTPLRMAGVIAIFAIGILHIFIGFKRSLPDFYTYELFNISPFYDFAPDYDCNNKNFKVFHTWEGLEMRRYNSTKGCYEYVYADLADIKKINGKYFCYNNVSLTYIELLNNGQIIKHGTECPEGYQKNCGRIDTLNQELCVRENDKCPLYDVGIGNPPDTINYIYDQNSNIYYSKTNFNVQNKSIIAIFTLSDGLPCYQSDEKLWRSFISSEAVESHLECTKMEIFGKKNDDRFKKTGEITYKRLYQDNLNERAKNKILNYINKETVSLYTREFLGIDKTCDKYLNSCEDFSTIKEIQNADKIIQIVQGFIMAFAGFVFLIKEIGAFKNNRHTPIPPKDYFRFYMAYIIISCGFLISKIITYVKAKNYVGSEDYNCSDSITNELIRKKNENNRKIFTYNKVCLFSEVAILGANFLVVIVGLFYQKFGKLKKRFEENNVHYEYKPASSDEIPDAIYPIYPSGN